MDTNFESSLCPQKSRSDQGSDTVSDGINEQEVFEDALDDVPVSINMDLALAIDETTVALNLFLNNKFSEAKERMRSWADRSMYHALGYGTIMYLQATLTFDTRDIQAAVEIIKVSLEVCQRFRRKDGVINSLSKMVKRPDYNLYTEEEVHAELCYAECLLERALLTFIQDENLISFVKGGLKIRACYQSYKECLQMLLHRDWASSKEKVHFETGVNLGVGSFNLLISRLPSRILRLLEFVGFSGNKDFGLSLLEQGCKLRPSLRGPLCSMILLSYHTVATYVLGTGDGDIELAESVLGPCLQDYPNGVIFRFFEGRVCEIKGEVDQAIKIFEDSMSLQIEWKQFHDLCYWELMWCHSFRCDWLQAYNYAEKLRMESRWSRATYAYQQAAFLLMQDDVSAETRQHVIDILADIPNLKQKVAGKSIPVEKFALRKARKFAMQGNRLVLPGLELIYIWNGFNIIGKTPALLEPLVQRVERTLVELDATKDENENYAEDFALCMLLKGMCLKGLKCTTQAENCFREAAACDKRIRYDHYIVPYSLVELGLLFMRDGRFEEAKRTLEQARGYYKHYSLESRLHFRIHSALAEVRQHVSPDHLKAEFKPAGYSPMHSGGSFPQPLTPPPEAVIGAGMASAIQPLTSDGAELDRLNCDTACEAIEKPI